MGLAVKKIGESERKAIWERGNKLRFRDTEFGESVGRLGGDLGRYLKICIKVLKVLCSSLEHFSAIENKRPQWLAPLYLMNSLKPGLYNCLSCIKVLS